jgi:hypothetical protein
VQPHAWKEAVEVGKEGKYGLGGVKKAKNGSGFTPKKMAGVLGQNGFDGP